MKSLDAFKMWIYRKMNRIKWKDKISNEELLKLINKERELTKDIAKRKVKYTGHIFRGSGGERSKLLIEGFIEGKRSRGKPRADWMNNIKNWSETNNYGELKKLASQRWIWRNLTNNLNLQISESDQETEV